MKLDHTALSCLDRCEQEYVYRHVRHLAPAEPDPSMHFGQIVHLGVKALYNGHSVEAAQQAMREGWLLGGGEGRAIECASGRAIDSTKPHLTIERASALVAMYASTWLATQPFACVWNEGYAESASEAGVPDRAVRYDGKLYAMDLKTTGLYITRDWQESFEHSQQAAMQLDVLEATLSEPLAGFWLDAIHVARARAPQAADFVRYGPLPYTRALRDELRRHREEKAFRAGDLRAYPEIARKSPGACVRYNKLCPYFKLCKADPCERKALVQIALAKGTLKEEAWKPSAR